MSGVGNVRGGESPGYWETSAVAKVRSGKLPRWKISGEEVSGVGKVIGWKSPQ